MFFIFFIGSVFFSSSDDWDDDRLFTFRLQRNIYWNGNYDSAYVNYRQAWKANDQYIEAMVGYGKVLVVRNEQDSAMIMFDKALAIDPDYKEASYNKALTYYNRAKIQRSLSCILAPVLEKNTDYYDAMLLIGDSYYEQKQFDDAMSWYRNAYENGRNSKPGIVSPHGVHL